MKAKKWDFHENTKLARVTLLCEGAEGKICVAIEHWWSRHLLKTYVNSWKKFICRIQKSIFGPHVLVSGHIFHSGAAWANKRSERPSGPFKTRSSRIGTSNGRVSPIKRFLKLFLIDRMNRRRSFLHLLPLPCQQRCRSCQKKMRQICSMSHAPDSTTRFVDQSVGSSVDNTFLFFSSVFGVSGCYRITTPTRKVWWSYS